MNVLINLNKDEKELVKSYASQLGLSVAEAFKYALFEKVEDEYDLSIGEASYAEYVSDGKKSHPIEELFKNID